MVSVEEVGNAEPGTSEGHSSEDEKELMDLLTLGNIKISSPLPLAQVVKLDLPNCGLFSLPKGLPDALPNLSIIFLSKNDFTEVPGLLGDCKNLQMMAFRDNNLSSIHPHALQPHTRWLILTNNKLTTLPDEIGNCRDLQKLMLSGNEIESLPDTIGSCQKLELVRLAANKLVEPPMALLEIPSLKWIGLGDNLFLKDTDCDVPKLPIITDISEDEGDVLGQGAGGVTRKVWYDGRYVAVKQYHSSSMTSDGTPAHERRIACATCQLSASCFIRVLGETKQGSLVMEYLDGYQTLAGPPSMQSCSRDVYEDDAATNHHLIVHTEQAERLVTTLLDGLVELHALGIIHGDFYGHNILVSNSSKEGDSNLDVRLSDFGAAYFYDAQSPYGKLLQRTELRALGVLVSEIAKLMAARDTGGKVQQERLQSLASRCESTHELKDLHVWWKQQQLKSMEAAFGADR